MENCICEWRPETELKKVVPFKSYATFSVFDRAHSTDARGRSKIIPNDSEWLYDTLAYNLGGSTSILFQNWPDHTPCEISGCGHWPKYQLSLFIEDLETCCKKQNWPNFKN